MLLWRRSSGITLLIAVLGRTVRRLAIRGLLLLLLTILALAIRCHLRLGCVVGRRLLVAALGLPVRSAWVLLRGRRA